MYLSDQEEMQEEIIEQLKEQHQAASSIGMVIMETALEDEKIFKYRAKFFAKQRDAFIAEGFSDESAVHLCIAIAGELLPTASLS